MISEVPVQPRRLFKPIYGQHPLDRAWVAHNVEIAGDVAGLWHIEPNHDPTAGVPSRVWVALSQRGGAPLPLDQVSCTLTVFGQPRAQPIASPVLTSAMQDSQQVPTAMVTFPTTGTYELELACQPKPNGSIAAFDMDYEVTVARSTSTASPVPIASSAPIATIAPNIPLAEPLTTRIAQPSPILSNPGVILAPLGLLSVIGILLWSKRPR